MRKKKALRAAAAVAMTGCLMQANCLSVNAAGVRNFTNGIIGSIEDGVDNGVAAASAEVSTFIADLIADTISGALP